MPASDQLPNQRDAYRPGSSGDKDVQDGLPGVFAADRMPTITPTASTITRSAAVTPNSDRHSAATRAT